MAVGSAVLIPLVVLARRQTRPAHPHAPSEESRSRLADLSQILQETISGNRVVKAFGMEDFEIRKFREAARSLLPRKHALDSRARAATSPLMDLLGAVVISMILFFARGEIKAGRMTLGLFGAFIFALFQGLRAGEAHRHRSTSFSCRPLGISTQVFAFLDLPEEQMDGTGAKALPRILDSDRIRQRELSSYDDGAAHPEGHRPQRSGGRRRCDRRIERRGQNHSGQFAAALLHADNRRSAHRRHTTCAK